MKIAIIAALLALAFGGAAQAQTTCSCATGTRTASAAALSSLLSGKMVCAALGSEAWQEWHNAGSLVDYKMGPGDQIDPSTIVGSYVVNVDNTISYTYGASTYKYELCTTAVVAGATTYAFCGAQFGGRDILNAHIGGKGQLTSCTTVPGSGFKAARR